MVKAAPGGGGRWVDPTIGRWTIPDLSGVTGGDTNFYRYVGNDPINFTDPSGRYIFLSFADQKTQEEYWKNYVLQATAAKHQIATGRVLKVPTDDGYALMFSQQARSVLKKFEEDKRAGLDANKAARSVFAAATSPTYHVTFRMVQQGNGEWKWHVHDYVPSVHELANLDAAQQKLGIGEDVWQGDRGQFLKKGWFFAGVVAGFGEAGVDLLENAKKGAGMLLTDPMGTVNNAIHNTGLIIDQFKKPDKVLQDLLSGLHEMWNDPTGRSQGKALFETFLGALTGQASKQLFGPVLDKLKKAGGEQLKKLLPNKKATQKTGTSTVIEHPKKGTASIGGDANPGAPYEGSFKELLEEFREFGKDLKGRQKKRLNRIADTLEELDENSFVKLDPEEKFIDWRSQFGHPSDVNAIYKDKGVFLNRARGRTNLLKDLAHEGSHAVEFAKGGRNFGLQPETLSKIQRFWSEYRAYLAERFVTGKIPGGSTDKLKQFIEDNYDAILPRNP